MNLVRRAVVSVAVLGALACSGSPETTSSAAQGIQLSDAGDGGGGGGGKSVFHLNQSGGNASGTVQGYDSSTQSYYFLSFNAWEDKTSKSRTAYLSFNGYGSTSQQVCYDEQICSSWDTNTWTCAAWETQQYCYYSTQPYYIYGSGEIPNNDFRVGAHTAHLTTDLSTSSSFYAQRCGYDSSWNWSCTSITDGKFEVTWQENGNDSWDSTQHTDKTSGPFTTHDVGHFSGVSANASGTALGNTVSTWGQIGQSKDNNTTRELVLKP